jgi:1-acyl-sn-glycerol-3-phosphate acyltransferase
VDREALSGTGIALVASMEDPNPRHIVSCGRPLPEHAIRIVDATGQVLPERRQGMVQFQGPSATRGYFRNPEATKLLFDGPWLNTGDLGYLATEDLYLTGREKDIIIRGGHNIHPQELEEAVNQVRGVHKGGVAVFPATAPQTGTERLVVLAEIKEFARNKERSRIQSEINRLAIDLLGLPVDDIVLVPPRTVLKTSSGKIRRSACRERYERGVLINAHHKPWRQILHLVYSGIKTQTKRWQHRCVGCAWSAWAWTVFAAIVPFAWCLIVLAPALTLRRNIARTSARLVLSLTGLTPRVEGLQHLAEGTPTIVVANHASYLDALILTAVLPPRFTYVAKQELLNKPLAALPLRRLDSAFVERFDSTRGAEDTNGMADLTRAGASLVFFPEGTFQSESGLLPFRLGAFVIAARCGIPVVPIALIGTRTLLRGERRRPHYSVLQVLIGEPLYGKGDDEWQVTLKLRDTARTRILARLGEPDTAT